MPEVRWGVLSTARIGRNAVTPAIQKSHNGRVQAVASRSMENARAYASELDIPRAHGSYEALLADSEIDVVYVPLPNALHKEWVVRAAEAGKHVLCEKPLALDPIECSEMQAAADANGVKLMEAFMYRFHPRSRDAFEIAASDRLGKVRSIRSAFSFKLRAADDIRRDPELGGGSLMDVGCYCVNVTRSLLGREPEAVQAFARIGPSGVDEELFATLRFEGGVHAQFHCALSLPRHEEVLVIGDRARLVWPRSFLPGEDPVELQIETSEEVETIRHDGVDEYQLMVEHFADCVLEDRTPRYSAAEAGANMAVIRALYASAEQGGELVEIDG